MSASLILHLLGHPQFILKSLPLIINRRAVMALVAYLAVNDSDEAHGQTREALSALLWPDYNQVKAFTNLRHTLWEIQKVLGSGWLITNRDRISLNSAANLWVDVHRFETLLSDGKVQSDISIRVPLIMEAVKLYRHHFLAGFTLKNAPTFDEWALTKAEDLRHKFAGALTLLIEDYCLLGEPRSALPYARRLVTLDPLNESAQRLLMQVYIQTGQHNAALKQYQTFEQTLRKELGVDPQPQIRILYKQIRKGEITPFQTKTKEVTVAPLNNLPQQLTSFVGRNKEKAEIIRMITKNRLVTLIGAGGVGKSRLAVQVADHMLAEFSDGVWFVELGSITDPLFVPRLTAITIGLREQPQRPVTDMLCEYLREKNILIILDNCEHVLDGCAHLLNALLKSCIHLKILTTSREPLESIGETIFRVPSLEFPEGEQSLDTWKDSASMKLFEERAQLVQFDFRITEENAPYIAQICHRLDGIPLAVELAAAKIGNISIEQILRQLSEGLNILIGGIRTDLPRHQTLRASINWSWGLMTKNEQVFMRQLSVFAGSWNLESLEAVCDGNVFELNNSLLNKSLIAMKREASHETRYYFHSTIRQYATEKLIESTDREMIHDRHLEYFLNLAETAAPHLIRHEQLEWLSILDNDYENLRAALEWTANKATTELFLRLCAALGRYWNIRCYWLEGSKWLETALSRPTQKASYAENAARVKALYHDAELASSLDDFERMLDSATLSLKLAKGGSDRLDTAIASLYVGRALKRRGNYDQAATILKESLDEFGELHASYWEAQSYRWLSEILVARGELTISERISQNLRLARIAGERLTLANSLVGYAGILFGRPDDAMKCIEEADILFKEVASQFNTSYFILAELQWSKGNYREAESIYLGMAQRHGLIGEKYMRSDIIANLGLIAMEMGELLKAQQYLEQALATAYELDDQVFISWRLAALGKLFYQSGDTDNSRRHFEESIASARDISPTQKIHILILFISTIYSQQLEVSTRILGSLNALLQRTGRHIFDPRPLEQYYDRIEAHARRVLDDSAFSSAFGKGERMSMEEAMNLILKTLEYL